MPSRRAASSEVPGLARGRIYLLTGLLACGRCSGVMNGRGRARADGTYQRRYGCANRDDHGEPLGCGRVFRDAAALDELVASAVFEWLDMPERAAVLAPLRSQACLAGLSRKLDRYQARRLQILGEHARGEIGKSSFAVTIAPVIKSIRETEAALALLRDAGEAGVLPAAMLKARWGSTSLDWQRDVIRLVVDRITVHPSRAGSGHIWNGHRFNPADITITWQAIPSA